jgi:TonB family protein
MMHLKTVAAAALFALISTGADAAPNVVTQPDWLEKPSADDLAENYPGLASALGVWGYAVISCSVSATGSLVDCQAVTERPIGLGFGRAAVAMSERFRMRPMTVNGKPVDGGTVRIPLTFRLPAADKPPPPAPISAEAERQAYRLVDVRRPVDGSLSYWEGVARDIENDDDNEAPSASRRAAADALRQASKAHSGDLRAAYARAAAEVFSEGEMASIADFYSGPGAAFQASSPLLQAKDKLSAEYWRDASATARATFCAQHACEAPDAQKVWRPADPRDSSRIDNPIWAEQPTEDTISFARPTVAGLLGFTGLVRLSCKVETPGALADCTVDEEAPTGFGYGAAALELASAGGYRLSPLQFPNGGAGRKVTVRVGFPAPSRPPPFTARAASPLSASVARRFFANDHTAETSRRDAELQIANYAARMPKGADKKLYEAALDAFRTGLDVATKHYLELATSVWSAGFTEPQVRALAAFLDTPAGKAWNERSNELSIAAKTALAGPFEQISADARAQFCKAHDCDSRPPQPIAESSEPSAARKP